MTLTELHALIGRRGSIITLAERLSVPVVIRNVREAFGRCDVFVEAAAEVSPEDPNKCAWVTLDRVRMEE